MCILTLELIFLTAPTKKSWFMLWKQDNSLSSCALRGSCREHARQPAVSSRLGFSTAGPLWLHHLRDHKRGLERGGPSQWLGYETRFMIPSDSSFSFAIVFISDVCSHAYLCSFDTVGVGTPGVLAWHSIPKLCTCICHHICAYLPCLSGQICVCQ